MDKDPKISKIFCTFFVFFLWTNLIKKMDPQQVTQLILASITTSSEEITNSLNDFLTDQSAPFVLLNILSHNPTNQLKHAAFTYLYKSMKNIILYVSEETQIEIQNQLLAIIHNHFEPDTYELIADNVSYLYEHDYHQYPGLLEFIRDQINIPERHYFGLYLLASVIRYMKAELCEELGDYLMENSLAAMNEQEIAANYLGFHVFVVLVEKISHTTEVLQHSANHFQRILELTQIVSQTAKQETFKFWADVESLLKTTYDFEDEFTFSLIEKAIEIASSEQIPTNLRSTCLETVFVVSPIPVPILQNTINAAFTLCAALMAEDHAVQEERIAIIEKAMFEYPCEEIFSYISGLVDNSLESESEELQATALLVYRAMLTGAPDFALKNIEKIIKVLETAITSSSEALVQAACVVLSHFDEGFKSLKCHSTQFLEPLLPLLICESPDMRVQAYSAIKSILDTMDTPIEGLFNQMIEILPNIEDDNLSDYIETLALAIPSTEGFDDDCADAVIGLIQKVSETDSLDHKASCFDLGLQLIKVDDAQIDTLNEMLMPIVTDCIMTAHQAIGDPENPETMDVSLLNDAISAIDYIGGLSAYLKDSICESIQEYIEPMISFIAQIPQNKIFNRLYKSSLRALARITKHCESLQESVFPHVFEGVKATIAHDKPSMQKTAIEAARKIRFLMTPEDRFGFYEKVLILIKEEPKMLLFIRDCFDAASKFIQMAEEQTPNYIALGNEVVVSVMTTQITFLNEKPLIESGAATFVFTSFCTFCANLLELSSEISNDIVAYLLQWYAKDDELAHFEVSKAFIATLKSTAVSPEVTEQILTAVSNDIANASEPSLQQNIVYFLNLLVQKHENMVDSVLSFIPPINQWYMNAKQEKFGYQDLLANIGSLYLTLAVRRQLEDMYINAALEEYPPYDTSEAMTMSQNIILLAKANKLNGPLAEQAALAIARFIVWDDDKVEKADIDEQTKNALIILLKAIVGKNPAILQTLERLYSKMRQKFRKISAILSK